MKPQFRTVLCLTICAGLLAVPGSVCAFAIAALGSIDSKGNYLSSDSFDSSDSFNGVWNVNGSYTNSLRKAEGDIVSTSAVTNSVIKLANAKIAGKVLTGPSGSSTIGPQGSVGDIPWITDSANNGTIKPGWSANDLSFAFQDVVLPDLSWIVANGPGTGGAGVVNGKTYDHVFGYSGNYIVPDSGTIYVDANVSVQLNITAGTFNPNYIYVAGAGVNAGRMVAYFNGPPGQSVVLGTDDKTQCGRARNLLFLGTANCTAVTYQGDGDFIGAIYAPQADFQFLGGGGGSIDFVGSIVAKTVQINGQYSFHFDEALRLNMSATRRITTSLNGAPAIVGQNVTFDVSAALAQILFSIPEPPVYQWRFNGTNIFNATNSSLSLTNVQLSDAGQYSVAITNGSDGSTPSTVLLVYASAVPALGAPLLSSSNIFQFTVSGVPGYDYIVESSTNFADWERLQTNVSPFIFSDTNLNLFPRRFFRAVLSPGRP